VSLQHYFSKQNKKLQPDVALKHLRLCIAGVIAPRGGACGL